MTIHDEGIERLIQEVLDGTASDAERTRLQDLLARDPAVRERHAELESLFRALSSVPSAEAPAGLEPAVMRAVAAEARAHPPRSGWLEAVRAALTRRPGVSLAYGFVAGALVGATVLGVMTGGLSPRVRAQLPVAGTMMPMPPRTAGALVARDVVRVGDANVTLEARRDGATIELSVDPGSAPGLETEVLYDEARLTTLGVTWSRPGRHVLDVTAGRAVTTQSGDEPFRLALAAAGEEAPLRVRLRRGAVSVERALEATAR